MVDPPPADAASRTRTAKPVATLQADTLCRKCSYNLIGQAVFVEPTTELLVVRCPECGAYHPTGFTHQAGLPLARWLARLWWTGYGLTLLAVYAGLVLASVNMHQSYLLRFTDLAQAHLAVPRLLPVLDWAPMPPELVAIGVRPVLATLAALGWTLGMLTTTFLWHVSRRRALYALGLPFAAAAWVAYGLLQMPTAESVHVWGCVHLLNLAVFEATWIGLGLWLGRPVARSLVSVLLPTRVRALFGFLWQADGKTMPT